MLQVFNDGNAKNFSTLEKKKKRFFFNVFIFLIFNFHISI